MANSSAQVFGKFRNYSGDIYPAPFSRASNRLLASSAVMRPSESIFKINIRSSGLTLLGFASWAGVGGTGGLGAAGRAGGIGGIGGMGGMGGMGGNDPL